MASLRKITTKDEYLKNNLRIKYESSNSKFIWNSINNDGGASIRNWIKRCYETEKPSSEKEIEILDLYKHCFFKMQKFLISACIKCKDEGTLNKLTKMLDGVTVKQFLKEELIMLESFNHEDSELFDLLGYSGVLNEWKNKLKGQIPEV